MSSITVCKDSHLYPHRPDNAVAYAALHRVDVTLQIYRTPIDPTAYPFHGSMNVNNFGRLRKADLMMTFSTESTGAGRLCLDYDFEQPHLMLKGLICRPTLETGMEPERSFHSSICAAPKCS